MLTALPCFLTKIQKSVIYNFHLLCHQQSELRKDLRDHISHVTELLAYAILNMRTVSDLRSLNKINIRPLIQFVKLRTRVIYT